MMQVSDSHLEHDVLLPAEASRHVPIDQRLQRLQPRRPCLDGCPAGGERCDHDHFHGNEHRVAPLVEQVGQGVAALALWAEDSRDYDPDEDDETVEVVLRGTQAGGRVGVVISEERGLG